MRYAIFLPLLLGINPDEVEYREAVLPEERLVLETVTRAFRRPMRLGPDAIQIEELAWGPHILDRIVWPSAGGKYDHVLVAGVTDQRKPAKFIRFVYNRATFLRDKDGVLKTLDDAPISCLFVVQDGKIVHQQSVDEDWREPWLRLRATARNAR